MPEQIFHIRTQHENQPITVPADNSVIIAGPNGSGKSALLAAIFKEIGANNQAEFFPGHRQITTSNDNFDSMQQNLAQLETNLFNNQQVFGRYRSVWPEDVYKAGIKRFNNLINDYNSAYVEAVERQDQAAIKAVKERRASLQTLNNIIAMGGLKIRIVSKGGQLSVVRGAANYGIDRMSDGERAILTVISSILARTPNTCVLVDEPERHLHPTITGPLWAATVRARPDLMFFFSTHDLDLISWLSPATVIHVTESSVISAEPEERIFDYHLLNNTSSIPEDLKKSIVGARKSVLFVEGKPASFDTRLYQLLFPKYHVKAVGSCETVIESTKSLASNTDLTWLTIKGIIDGDGRSDAERAALVARGIEALVCPTIENLFFMRPIIETMARYSDAVFGLAAIDRVARIEQIINKTLNVHRQDIISRQATWQVNRAISGTMVSVADIVAGTQSNQVVDIVPIIADVTSTFDSEVAKGAFSAIASLPIKNTVIPDQIAKSLGWKNEREYKNIILSRISENDQFGSEMRFAFLMSAPRLPDI